MAGHGNGVYFDEIADGLLPDVNELSGSELDDLLDTESETLTRFYFDRLAKDIGETKAVQNRDVRAYSPQLSVDVVPKTVLALTEYARSQIFAHFRNASADTWNADAWRGTHLPARVLRQAEEAAAGPGHRAYLLNGIFDALEETTRGYLGVADAHLDDLWPLLECLEQLGSEASSEPMLADVYAKRYAMLATRGDSEALGCSFAWLVNELLERGRASQRLASQVAAELVRVDRTDRTRCILTLLLHLRPRDCRSFPVDEMHKMGKGCRRFVGSLVAHVERTKHLMSISLATDRPGRLSFDEVLPREFFQLLDLARHGSPLPAVSAMAAIKLSLRGAYAPLERAEPRARSAAISYICTVLVDRVAGREAGVAFPACEALEGLRDRFKRETGDAMAELLDGARPLVRQGAFVFIAEGYEESFRGRRQKEVPQFVDSRGRIRFFSHGHESDLNAFSRKAARLATHDPDLRQNLDWMNQRLQGWLLRSAS